MNEKRFKNLIEISELLNENDSEDVSAVLDREDLLELKDLIKTNFRLVEERNDLLDNCMMYDETLNKSLEYVKSLKVLLSNSFLTKPEIQEYIQTMLDEIIKKIKGEEENEEK